MSNRRLALATRNAILASMLALVIGTLAWGEPPSPAPKVGGTVIVVRPARWQSALERWKEYRSQEYAIVEIDSPGTSHEQQQAIRDAALRCQPPATAILLCGDVAREIDPREPPPPGKLASPARGSRKAIEILTPGMVLDTSVRLGPMTTPSLCTDATFGDLDGDGCPDIAVGRLPAKSPTELERMLERSILYESVAPGPWNDTVHVTAGVGGFGVIADTAIETVTRRFLTEGIPDHFRMQMTYASCTSSYCPNPLRLRESYIDRINQGGLFWVYIGHGSVTHLDYMQAGNDWLPIGEADDAGKFHIRSRPPIAIMLACFTGAYDANVDCFAERLLAQEAGPVAVIAGSRVTMPYGLSQLASEMINGCFRDRIPTLGEVVLQAKLRIWEDDSHADSQPPAPKNAHSTQRIDIRQRYRKIVTDMAMALNPGDHDLLAERREHVRLMNLLGDPLLKIPYPETIQLNTPSLLPPGSSVRVEGTTPIAGTLAVELALVRDRLPDGIVPISAYDGSPAQLEQMQSVYDTANDLRVARVEQNVAPGEFGVDVEIPADLKGRCVISAFVYGDTRWAVGSQRVTVRTPK
ncbi:MAG: C25 family cysteine peptidase [Pirellula sp.]|nr:C25 family cysteine peptidase [Pirellula sp.]